MNIMRKLIYILLFSICCPACTETDEIIVDPYKGCDNFLYAFSLQIDGATYRAAITDNTIRVTVPPELQLADASAVYELSEKAMIAPDPATVVDWEAPMEFTITACNGEQRSYSYELIRLANIYDGDIVLRTQEEVDAFYDSGITAISGSLILGDNSKESLKDLAGLGKITEIGGSVVFMNCADIETIDLPLLEKVGDMYYDYISYMYPQMLKVESVNLPKLKTVTYGFYVPTKRISLPALEYVGGDLTIISSELEEESLSRLQRCNGKLELRNRSASFEFPVLTFAGDLFLMMKSANFSQLSETGNIEIWDGILSTPMLEKCSSLIILNGGIDTEGFPMLTQVAGSINAGNTVCPLLKHVDGNVANGIFPALEYVGGSLTDAECPELTTAPQDVQNCKLPKVSSVSGVVRCEFYSELVEKYPMLHEVGGLYIGYISGWGWENSDAVWDLSRLDIGKLGLEIRVPASTVPLKIIGQNKLPGRLKMDISDPIMCSVEGFTSVEELYVYTYNGSSSSSFSSIELPQIEEVAGDCHLHGQRVELSNLKSVGGHLEIESDAIFMPALERIGKRFTCQSLVNDNRYVDIPFVIDFPKLTEVGDNTLSSSQICFYICDYTVPELEFPELCAVHGRMVIGGIGNEKPIHGFTKRISMPKLHIVEGSLDIGVEYFYYKDSNVNELNFPALKSVASIAITRHPQLFDFSTFSTIVSTLKNSTWSVSDCGYNPTLQDMLDGKYLGE